MVIDFVTFRYGRYLPSFRRNRHLFPLFEFQDALQERGLRLRFLTLEDLPAQPRGSVLCLDSRVFSYQDSLLCRHHLDRLKEQGGLYERVLWFDNRDSAGTTQFEVLPFVDVYCKKQYLRDRELYRRSLYGGRLYTDFIYHTYGIVDHRSEHLAVLLDQRYEQKLRVSWSLAYSDLHAAKGLWRYAKALVGSREPRFYERSAESRTIDIQARYTTSYDSKLIEFHRQSLLEAVQNLDQMECRSGRIPRDQYQDELKRTKAVLSPFGWGEICYRDFEAMIYGCALIKPSVAHIETWPDLFVEGKTYLPLSWEVEVARRQIEEVLANGALLNSVANAGQDAFRSCWGEQGANVFCDHFSALVSVDPRA